MHLGLGFRLLYYKLSNRVRGGVDPIRYMLFLAQSNFGSFFLVHVVLSTKDPFLLVQWFYSIAIKFSM